MNRIFKFIFALLLMLNLANAKTLIFGSDAEYPPFGYMDENNKIAGFDIDLVDAISKKAGFEYKFIKVGFDALIPALKVGKIDAIAASMSATTERKKSVDFSYTLILYKKFISKNGDRTLEASFASHSACSEYR